VCVRACVYARSEVTEFNTLQVTFRQK